jgi:hypothetical protein
MDRTTDGLEGVFAYMDDSRVGSPDRQTHFRHLEAFFTALAPNGLAINLEKCVFATPSLEILGHRISATGSAPTADHAAKIENCPPPQDIKQLQRFLGMVNFYRHFLPNCALVLKPLNDLLRGGGQNVGSGPFPPRRHSRMQNASWRRRCPSNTLPQMLSFLWPLTPPILISEGSCNKKRETIGDHLDSFPENSRTWNHVIQLLTANCGHATAVSVAWISERGDDVVRVRRRL